MKLNDEIVPQIQSSELHNKTYECNAIHLVAVGTQDGSSSRSVSTKTDNIGTLRKNNNNKLLSYGNDKRIG